MRASSWPCTARTRMRGARPTARACCCSVAATRIARRLRWRPGRRGARRVRGVRAQGNAARGRRRGRAGERGGAGGRRRVRGDGTRDRGGAVTVDGRAGRPRGGAPAHTQREGRGMGGSIDRRTFLGRAGAAAAAVGAAPRVKTSRAAAQSNRLVVAVGQWGIETPFAWRSSQSEKTLWESVYDSLITRDPKTFGYRIGLATEWRPSNELRTWTFKLRQGVQ